MRRRGSRGDARSRRMWSAVVALAALWTQAGASGESGAESPCSEAWYRSVGRQVSTGDARQHGPDVGSDEWKAAIEFKLGVRGAPDVPSRDSDAWCRYVDRLVRERAPAAPPAGPSFACGEAAAGSIEDSICKDPELSALDRELAGVYSAAAEKARNEHPPVLKAEQRGWIKGRDDCWKNDDERSCVEQEYRHRIAELQARYRLVPGRGPFAFTCDGNPAKEVVVTFFQTDPQTLIAELGDGVSLMYQQPSGSGARYQGRNESFWEHGGEALVRWGYGAPEMRCKKVR